MLREVARCRKNQEDGGEKDRKNLTPLHVAFGSLLAKGGPLLRIAQEETAPEI